MCALSAVVRPVQAGSSASRAAEAGVEKVSVRPLATALEMLGSEGSAALVVQLESPASQIGKPVLALYLQASAAIIRDASTLTLEMDDVPVATTFLTGYSSSRPWSVVLAGAGEGFHVLRLRTRLLSGAPPCAAAPGSAPSVWLRILPGSELAYLRQKDAAPAPTVSGLLAQWRRERSAVLLAPRQRLAPQALAAYLEADALIRSLSAQPAAATNEDAGSTPQLSLEIDAREPLLASSQVVGVAAAQSGKLVVKARSDAELAQALSSLRSLQWQQACQQPQCILGRAASAAWTASASRAGADSTNEAAPALPVMRLAERGYPRGYVARGEGRHVLRLQWQRPAWWTLNEWPELRLVVDASPHPALRLSKSSVEVFLNSRSIGRFELSARAQQPSFLMTRIPAQYWQQAVWTFDLVVTLRSSAEPPHCVVDEGSIWLALAAESALLVPRLEPRYDGSLRDFDERARSRRPVLVCAQPVPGAALAVLGAVLFPWAGREPWQVVAKEDACGPLCVVVKTEQAGDAAPAIRLSKSSCGAAVCERLTVSLGSQLDRMPAVQSPRYDLIVNAQAELVDGRWSALGETGRQLSARRARPAALEAPTEDSAPASEQHLHRQLLDGLWLVCVVLLAAAAWAVTARTVERAGKRSRT